mmetsp:Transcript_117706/g.230995  ORF Transcript_117706/g.230995 Transcript_117706/m.230995 type:complete len:157 (+) Transcript_117706:56-526(+)
MGEGGFGKGGGFGDKGKGKGKGKAASEPVKGKGKGKGKNPGAPPADDPYWEQKVAEEGRQEGDGTVYTGVIKNYNFRAGWGFILVDDFASLPAEVQAAMEASVAEEKAKGKDPGEVSLIYFRKPDIAEGYKPEREQAVTFQVYTDLKGAGAYNVSG